MSYKFNLQKVLDFRVTAEEEQNRRLAAAYREVEEARAALDNLRQELARLQAEYSSRQAEQVDVPAALLAGDYIARMHELAREQESVLALCEARLQKQVQLAERAMQERKTMDTLRSKDYERFVRQENLAEQRLSDEVAGLNFIKLKQTDL